MKYDFGGYATKVNLVCSDGRVIRANSFEQQDGARVPLVWQHQRNEVSNVLGHAILENRADGVYAYCKFNDSENGQIAKGLVQHGDIDSLSIYANNLIQKGRDVVHGKIIEVSLVLAGANPGARIDNLLVEHSDGEMSQIEDEAIIYVNEMLEHSVERDENQNRSETVVEHKDSSEKTVQEVFDSMTEEQKTVVYALLGQALADEDEDDEEEEADDAEHSEDEGSDETLEHNDKGDAIMKKNVFEGDTKPDTNTLSHSEIQEIFADAKKYGSLKDAALEHGVENLEILFPEAKAENPVPQIIDRDQTWVSEVWGGAHKTPFSRVKSITADITKDEARAKGYIKGKKKLDEQFSLLKRVTTPQTVYKKQSMDRDDIVDIVDFDFVAFLKSEMRGKLIEELARAMLVSDGRAAGAEDKINESNIRPIAFDDDLYAIHYEVTIPENATREQKTDAMVDAANLARVDYKGSGSPTLFINPKSLADMLLAKDKIGRRMYANIGELATAMRVSKIVEVPVMEGVKRVTGEKKHRDIYGIIVNMKDYTIGADRGGAVTMFDDFDIDYNKEKYLIETRCSGALTVPYSAIVLEGAEVTDAEAAG